MGKCKKCGQSWARRFGLCETCFEAFRRRYRALMKALGNERSGRGHGGVGCIVGQALKRLGCSDEYVSKLDRLDSCGIDHVAKRHFWPDLAGWIDEWEEATEDVPEINWLSVVQMEQDNGHSWGAALETADIDQPLHKPKYVKQDQQN